MRKILVTFLLLSGCATVSPSFVRDGKQVYEAKCPGTMRSIADCHKLAAKQCNGKYEEMGRESNSSFMQNNFTGEITPIQTRSLLFVCKA